MKIRQGFVSNSSSSSFIIGVKGDLTEEKLMKAFNVPKDSPMYVFAEEIASLMLTSEKYSLKEYMDNECYDSEEEIDSEIKEIFDKNMNLYQFSEELSCFREMKLNYHSEDLIIIKEEY